MEEFKNQIVKLLQDSNYVESEGEWVRKRSIQTPGQVIIINGQQMNQPGRTIEVIDKCDMWEGEMVNEGEEFGEKYIYINISRETEGNVESSGLSFFKGEIESVNNWVNS